MYDLFAPPPSPNPVPTHTAPARNTPLSVTRLNRIVRELLEGQLSLLTVVGELSNVTLAPSGHWYFTLKDREAQVRCTFFRQRAQYVSVQPKAGDQVEVSGRVSFYEARGDFQLNIESLKLAGAGDLHAEFLRRKDRLIKGGWTDAERKRPLPVFPAAIGVITSPSGAALHDVLTTLARRAPMIKVVIYPCVVQGRDAPASIARALASAIARREVGVLIIGRGGGSLEDLWAFNDEALAEAVAACPIPTISAVGHETDVTLLDFVADYRAATPTAAAVAAAPDTTLALAAARRLSDRLTRVVRQAAERRAMQLDSLALRLLSPAQRVALLRGRYAAACMQYTQALRRQQLAQQRSLLTLANRLQAARPAVRALPALRAQLGRQSDTLKSVAARQLARWQARLARASAVLATVNPRAVLARGYALVTDAQGKLVLHAASAPAGATLQLELAQGQLQVVVQEKPKII